MRTKMERFIIGLVLSLTDQFSLFYQIYQFISWRPSLRFSISLIIRAGTRLFKNRRLIEYLKEATRSARLGTRSVLGAAGKVEIWIIFDIKQSKKCQHKTSTFAFLFLFNPPNITKPSICRESSGVKACPVWDHLGPLQVQVHHVAKIKWKVEKLDNVSGQVVL